MMNQRISEMWRISVLKHSGTPMNWNRVAEDFASSLIQECTNLLINEAQILYSRADFFGEGRTGEDAAQGAETCLDNVDLIKTHFGINQ